MAKNNAAALKTLAREMKKNAVKLPKSVATLAKIKAPVCGKGYCGRHSELPTDINWAKVPRGGYFDKVKGDRGNNRALVSAMVASTKI